MERKDEIKVLLKELLGKAELAINKNQYSDNMFDITHSSKELLKISKQIEIYLLELENLI